MFLTFGVIFDGEEKAGGIKPRLTHPNLKIILGPATLVGKVGEGAGVQSEPFLIVETWQKRPNVGPRWPYGFWNIVRERATHAEKSATVCETKGLRQGGGTALSTACPESKSTIGGLSLKMLDELVADTPSPSLRCDG